MKDFPKETLKLYKKPRLKKPRMIAAWGSIGVVGFEAALYLKDKLKAKEFAEIEPYDYFDISVMVEKGMIEELRYPKTKLYYWKNKMGNDLLFCIADYEPMQKRYKYVETILDLAEKYEAEMLFTISAFTTHIQHDEEPKVFAAVNSHELITYLNQWDIAPAKEIDLSSINALILGLAQKRNIHGIFLLSEVPSYTTDIANPKSGMAVTSVLSKMLDLNIDMVDIRESARLAEIDIDKKIKAASWEFIDQFTVDYRDLFQKDEDQE